MPRNIFEIFFEVFIYYFCCTLVYIVRLVQWPSVSSVSHMGTRCLTLSTAVWQNLHLSFCNISDIFLNPFARSHWSFAPIWLSHRPSNPSDPLFSHCNNASLSIYFFSSSSWNLLAFRCYFHLSILFFCSFLLYFSMVLCAIVVTGVVSFFSFSTIRYLPKLLVI